jgi:hypothetical protein
MQSKACHLELTMGMTAEELILAIERIVGRRGTIDKVHSDNGPNFAHTGKILTDTDVDDELQSSLKEVDWNKVQQETTHGEGIREWSFSQPLNPEGNGLAEAHVKLAKRAMETKWKKKILHYDQFQTLVVKAENKINSRPIGGTTGDHNKNFLTPNHFMYGRLGSEVVPVMREDKAVIHKERWEEVLEIFGEFSLDLAQSMLNDMHSRDKWQRPQIDLQENQNVVMINPTSKRADWSLGRVTKTYPGPDGAICNADIEMVVRSTMHLAQPKKTILRRNVRQLILLDAFSEKAPPRDSCRA